MRVEGVVRPRISTVSKMSRILQFESKQEKTVFFAIMGVVIIMGGITFYPVVGAYVHERFIRDSTPDKEEPLKLESQKTPREYYDMFQCSCCGQPIDVGCCGMAKQRKAYLDKLLLENMEEDEIVYQMVKKFGFDVLMNQSKEQEVRDYIMSKASDNPPKIEIENPVYDFGTVSQADGNVSTTFTVRNAGSSDLVIENLDSSCMCTTATMIHNGKESPRFGMSMHGDNPDDYELKLAPGDTAELKVYYDPNAHGKQRKPEVSVIREVTIISNDPVDFQKKVRVKLTQTP